MIQLLQAFWLPKQNRFCELTDDELRQKSGFAEDMETMRMCIASGLIWCDRAKGDKMTKTYGLTPAGIQAFDAVKPKDPNRRRLTADPRKARRVAV